MSAKPDLPTPLVSTDWLAAHLGEPDLVVIDASWRMPGGGDAHADYVKRHIAGAVFFPIDAIADRSTRLPHMLAAPEDFGRAVGALGVGDDCRIVVYDDQGLFSAARVWWNFLAMGHDAVAVLDGGLPKWIAEGRPLSDAAPQPAPRVFHARPRPELVADHRRVRDALSGAACIIDARPAGRFRGLEAEPRPGLRSGHMPGAINIPASDLLDPGGRLKPPGELRRLLDAAGAADERPVIASCGSGITAAAPILALASLGRRPGAVYDGSWAEWGREDNDPDEFPVEAGAD